MGKKVRVLLGENDMAQLANQKNCKAGGPNCFFCELLDCQYIQHNGEKRRVGTVRLYGKNVPIIFSPQEGFWLPYLSA
jgi:hypothetical protein